MKRLLTLLAAVVALHNFVSAQTGVAIGMRAGVGFSGLTFGSNRSPLSGFRGGVFADFIVSDLFSLRTGIDYMRMGGKINNAAMSHFLPSGLITLNDANVINKIDYLSIPVQAVFGWEIAGSKLRLNAGAGVFLSILLKHENKVRLNVPNTPESQLYFGNSIPNGYGSHYDPLIRWRPDDTAPSQLSPGMPIFRNFADTGHPDYARMRSDNKPRPVNLGPAASVGLSHQAGPRGTIMLDYGFNFGLINLYKSTKTRTYTNSVTLGYRVRL